jgi:two-component system sensor histidine kinase MtrB
LLTRIVVGVGAVALLLSAGLGTITYLTVRSNLIEERQQNAVNQLGTNAQLLASALRSTGVDESQLLGSLRPQVRSRPMLLRNGEWFTASLQMQPDQLPPSLLEAVMSGTSARQRFSHDGELLLAVGAALPNDEGIYVEVFSLTELNRTLATLRNTLLIAGATTTAVGIGLGLLIARRATAPLLNVGRAARDIAEGRLDTRLDSSADRDLQQLTESFNQMADSLKDRIDNERRFASDVSHELRSPLTTLLTTVAVLENRRHELSAEGQEALDLLSADIDRFQRMVRDLIEIAKHDAGIAELSWSRIPAAGYVLSVLRRLRVDEKLIDVTEQAETAAIRIDERRLERTLANLIENAALYGDDATRVTVDADDRHVRIAVEDRGPGIPEEERERIFDRFARGVHSRRRANLDGSGLGLALAKENVALMDGRIWVERFRSDGDSDGARFVIELPRADS